MPTDDLPSGLVLTGTTPDGYARLHRRTVVGTARDLDRLGAAVLAWRVQRGSGIAVRTPEGREAPDATEGFRGAVVVPLLGPLRVVAPVVVTTVLRERDRIGLIYGTLPGHPETGEEAFIVAREGRETVFELRALSRPAFPHSLAPLVGRAFQRRFTERCLRALTAV